MVAGVAMGLILEEDGQFQVLTDILGSEDALGDMDFKVAGDAEGVTAFQMDIKVSHRLSRASHSAQTGLGRIPAGLQRVLTGSERAKSGCKQGKKGVRQS